MTAEDRRTKRRYAHELYPEGDEHEVRSLAVEVPQLYARALGLEVLDTGWASAGPQETGSRIMQLVDARQIAFLADALSQDLVGQEAWEWAMQRASDESGEWVYERAVEHGVDPEAIKPYPCGTEPTTHAHYGPEDRRGFRRVTTIPIPEIDCADCTEPVPAEVTS